MEESSSEVVLEEKEQVWKRDFSLRLMGFCEQMFRFGQIECGILIDERMQKSHIQGDSTLIFGVTGHSRLSIENVANLFRKYCRRLCCDIAFL